MSAVYSPHSFLLIPNYRQLLDCGEVSSRGWTHPCLLSNQTSATCIKCFNSIQMEWTALKRVGFKRLCNDIFIISNVHKRMSVHKSKSKIFQLNFGSVFDLGDIIWMIYDLINTLVPKFCVGTGNQMVSCTWRFGYKSIIYIKSLSELCRRFIIHRMHKSNSLMDYLYIACEGFSLASTVTRN
jgi:hypothetical protein